MYVRRARNVSSKSSRKHAKMWLLPLPPRHVANGNGRANGGIPGNPALSAIEKGTPRATSQLQNAPFFLLRGKTSSGSPIIEYPLPPSNMFPFSLLTSPRRRGASEKVGSFGARLSPIPSSALLIRPCFSFASRARKLESSIGATS